MKIKKLERLSSYINTTHNNMKVIDVVEKNNRAMLKVKCHCGKDFITRVDFIVGNKIKSCGCSKSNHLKDRNRKYNHKKLPNFQAAINILYRRYKKGAQERGLAFELDADVFVKIIKENCKYCGVEPRQEIMSVESTGILKYNGIDRFDNSKGYEKDNVVACCKRCNFFKGGIDGEDFIELVGKIHTNQKIKSGIKTHKFDNYYQRALAVASNSPDQETKVGAILINRDSGAIIADGYNGFCRGSPDHLIPKTRPDKHLYIIHAEINLICNCVRHGIKADNCVVFCTLSPCINCCRALYQSGITTVIFKDKYKDFDAQVEMLDLYLDLSVIGDYYMINIKPKRD